MNARRMPLLAAAVGLAVYLPSLGGGFLYDDSRLLGNRSIRELGDPLTLLRAEPSRPLLGLSWALNYAFWGYRPWSYHLVNVLLHAANAALVAWLFLWIAGRSGRPPEAALLGACLFAATPMAAETVAYVSSRSTALATALSLATLCVALPLLERFSMGRLAAALGLYVLALASKEEAVSVPLLLILLDLFFVARHDARAALARWRVHAPFVLAPLLGLAARRGMTGTWLPEPAMDLGRYLATQLAVFPGYLLRALIPFDPAFFRGQAPVSWPPQAWAIAGWLATAVLAASAAAGRRRWPLWSFAVLWLAAGLLPSSSLLPLSETVVDHRAYLGSAGIALLWGVWLWRPGRAALVSLALVLLAVASWRYERVLGDPVRAWEDATARAPHSADAWRALGDAYASRRDPRAIGAYRSALQIHPEDARGWTNLGAFYFERRQLAEAAEAMRSAAQAAPSDARIHDNLALILQALGREDEAVQQLEAAVSGQPALAQPRIQLAAVMIRRGRNERARALIDEAARLPLDPEDEAAIQRLLQRLPPAS